MSAIKQVKAYAAYAAKALTGLATAVAVVVNLTVPEYSEEAQWLVGVTIAVLGTVAQYNVKNASKPA